MERALARSQFASITPAADGWRVHPGANGSPAATYPSLEAAAGAVPEGASLRLSLPVGAVIMEKMRLPSTDREELGGMVVLQLEKTFPYNGDEITSGFQVLRQEENESELLAFAVSNEGLNGLCEPLRAQRKLPEQVAIFAAQLAGQCAREELAALVFREQDSVVLGVVQQGKLAAAQATHANSREAFLEELPRLLLTFELEGIPIHFSKVLLERELAGWRETLSGHFGDAEVETIPVDQPLEQGPVNLMPAAWMRERHEQGKAARLRERLMLAGGIYLALLLLAAGYIIWLQRQVGRVAGEVAATAPAVDSIAARKARWMALSPAIDPSRYPVEILNQINRVIPSEDLHVTVFEDSPAQFMVEGEAPTASLAIQYGEALKNDPDLQAFHFESGPPEILANEHAHFRIFGKL